MIPNIIPLGNKEKQGRESIAIMAVMSNLEFEQVGDLRRKLSFTISRSDLDVPMERRLKEMGTRIKIKGFRPGKIPLKVLKSRYGKTALNEVVSSAARESFSEYVSKEKRSVAYYPDIQISPTEGDFKVECEFDELPDVKVPDLKGLKIKRPLLEVTGEDLDMAIDRVRKEAGQPKAAERPAKADDILTIDYNIFDGDEIVWGTKGKVVPVPLDSVFALPLLVDELLGKSVGDKGSLQLEFPSEHVFEKFSGKSFAMSYEVKTVSEIQRPEIDANFVQSLGVESGKVEDLREKMRESLVSNSQPMIDQVYRNRTIFQLLEATPDFSLPGHLVQIEERQLAHQAVQGMLKRGYPGTDFLTGAKPDIRKEAERKVRLGLIVRAVAAAIDFKIMPGMAEDFITRLDAGQGQAAQSIERYKRDPDFASLIDGSITESRVFGHVFSEVHMEDERLSMIQLRDEHSEKRNA